MGMSGSTIDSFAQKLRHDPIRHRRAAGQFPCDRRFHPTYFDRIIFLGMAIDEIKSRT